DTGPLGSPARLPRPEGRPPGALAAPTDGRSHHPPPPVPGATGPSAGPTPRADPPTPSRPLGGPRLPAGCAPTATAATPAPPGWPQGPAPGPCGAGASGRRPAPGGQ